MAQVVRIVTFNIENLDDVPGQEPTLADRVARMTPQLNRLRADILCLQEVHGQEQAGEPRKLLALEELLAGTPYSDFEMVSTKTADGEQVFDKRNLVTLSRFPITDSGQFKHDFLPAPAYKPVTEDLPDGQVSVAKKVTWERPILRTTITLPDGKAVDVINLHLKSRLPSNITGQRVNQFVWKTVPGWAEGYFLSSMKRVGQALETRMLVDELFDQDETARIVVCGDFNADNDDVPVEAIRGDVENTGNSELGPRTLVPCERTIPESSRFSLYHNGQGNMLDHLYISQSLLEFYNGTEIHNEKLHDESRAFASDIKFPESDHAPVVAEFMFP